MDIELPTPMLGGISPQRFMQRHWQKKALLVRQTGLDYFTAQLGVAELLALAEREDVQSRSVRLAGAAKRAAWSLQHGPFDGAQPLPKRDAPNWTVLVQGVDRVHAATHALMQRFAFVPQARLDDVMLSYATDGGGVGAHVDSYDVFLLQVHGKRRWRWGHQKDLSLKPGLPLKILRNFQPEHEAVLEPGDMLYIPPGWAHEGTAVGECVTASIGFRAPSKGELLKELLHRAVDQIDDESLEADEDGLPDLWANLYADANQVATTTPAAVPELLQAFATQLIAKHVMNSGTSGLFHSKGTACMLGEHLSVPHSAAAPLEDRRLSAGQAKRWPAALRLSASTRMLYDQHHVFANGQSWRAAGADAKLMRKLADSRALSAAELSQASTDAQALLKQWLAAGWVAFDKSGAHAGGQK